MATAVIIEGRPLSVPDSAPISAPAASASAWPKAASHDYDAYRAEARRLRSEAIKSTLLLAGRRLRRIVAG